MRRDSRVFWAWICIVDIIWISSYTVESAGVGLKPVVSKNKDALPGTTTCQSKPEPSGRLYYLPANLQESEP